MATLKYHLNGKIELTKSGYGLRMYMYRLYIHFRIHIRFLCEFAY